MTTTPPENSPVTRRRLLIGAGLAAAVGAVSIAAPADAAPASPATPGKDLPGSLSATNPAAVPTVDGLHLQFGADASSEVVVSWHTLQPVEGARALLGDGAGNFEKAVAATTRTYVDAKSGRTVYAHHAALKDLNAATGYLYAAVHAGATPEFGTFTTGPRGRARVTFTSFGDQGTPTLGKKTGMSGIKQLWENDNLGSPAAGDTTGGVERVQPMFHLFNGDLCYANLATDRVRTWWDFWTNNSRSARNRPWMPSAGNHENERGNGPIGYAAYQTYFEVPAPAGQSSQWRGLWYSFTVGAVRVISIANDDVCYQDGGDHYVRGYSNGEQRAWLESALKDARSNEDIDWVVVCMHQCVVSTANNFNGADLGIRQEFVPLFDKYGVDLVVCGHEHHYERSHPIRGQMQNQTLTPITADTNAQVIDTTKGTVHMILGGGGTSVPSNSLFYNPPQCRVIVGVQAPGANGKRAPIYVQDANTDWSSVRDVANSYGFGAFEVDPGTPGGETTMKVTYLNVTGLGGGLETFETFTLRRPRSDSRNGSEARENVQVGQGAGN
ncbi:metallophosphoesterase family protein [Sinomonas sp. ASV322]|uniref:purple acid phosphatase family protein n=1 Tax=Sinomonas sp. ASV322 TaxID=3041920 RepID=UPI0027DE75A4|nr:metallophosphoesterase family protein [Sinomonas sp. ASV322]MDQ4502291.1 metallophosphoesterase family protein [Sinomonas sp. ASV322]